MKPAASPTTPEVPAVLLLSAQRSRNLGDLAMLDSARAFLTESFPRRVDIEVLGPRDERRSHRESGPEAGLPVLVRLKQRLFQGRNGSFRWAGWGLSANGVHGPLGCGLRLLLAGWILTALLLLWCHRLFHLPVPRALRELSARLRRVSAVVTTGGGWLNSNFILTLYEHLLVLLAARLIYGLPVCIIGEQVGPLQNPLDRYFVRCLFRRVQLIALRDPQSVALTQRLLGEPDRVRLFCDWAYSWRERERLRVDGPLRIGVNLRRAHYSPFGDPELSTLALALDAFHRQTGAELHFIPTCFDPLEPDDAVLLELRERSQYPAAITLHADLTTPAECVSLAGGMDVNLAVSYHFCLFSLMSDIPCLAIATSDYYASKLGGLLELFDVGDWLISPRQIGDGSLADALKQCVRPSAVAHLRAANRRLSQQRQEAGSDLRELLASQLAVESRSRPRADPSDAIPLRGAIH